jgi:lysozyme
VQTSDRGLKLMEEFEGFSATPYVHGDATPTIGYGTTGADVNPLPAHLTRDQAERLLKDKLTRKYEPAVNDLHVPLTQNQFDALVSFAYNCGPGSMQWDVGRALRRHDYAGAAACFENHAKVNGVVWAGLLNRRQQERALFLAPDSAPDPYERFLDSIFLFSRESLAKVPAVLETFQGPKLELNERATVREYDRLMQNPEANRTAIARHRQWLLVLRKRVWQVAHDQRDPDGRPSWDRFARGWRWRQLNERTKGMN